jgi:hypothetical protein
LQVGGPGRFGKTPLSYKLDLPRGWKMYPWFHPNLLKLCTDPTQKPATGLTALRRPTPIAEDVQYEDDYNPMAHAKFDRRQREAEEGTLPLRSGGGPYRVEPEIVAADDEDIDDGASTDDDGEDIAPIELDEPEIVGDGDPVVLEDPIPVVPPPVKDSGHISFDLPAADQRLHRSTPRIKIVPDPHLSSRRRVAFDSPTDPDIRQYQYDEPPTNVRYNNWRQFKSDVHHSYVPTYRKEKQD